ncbi:MAG TPA: peptidylprolyl isomerase [Ktedonobacterales bacterium]|nr:peptidylprolyl isomerase [Ktedonobacterales bacterium]
MSTPTQHPPSKQRVKSAKSGKAAPGSSAKANRASGVSNRVRVKQTARVSGLRDGKALIFGWGRDLTRAQKTHYQHLALWSFIGLIGVAIIGTLVFGVFNELVIIPNKTIVSVNGTNITQDTYRKELAYQAQTLWNKLQNEIGQKNAIQAKVQAGDPTATAEDSLLSTQLQADEANYAQAQITQASANALEDNVIILQGEKTFEQQDHAPSSAFEPTQKQVNDALAAFKKAFPNGETYAQFLSANGLSNADVVNSITIQLRRGNMQTYLAKRLVSPARQVHLRRIQVDTAANAAKIRAQLVAGKLSDATWSDLAKKSSLDTTTKDIGGDMGWTAQGTGDGGIEYWAYNSSRKVGDLSPVIFDVSGTYDIVQVLGIDPSRAVDPATLKAAQDNALSHWLAMQRIIPGAHIGSANSTMLTDARNLPKKPDLNATLPAVTPTVGSGIPGMP